MALGGIPFQLDEIIHRPPCMPLHLASHHSDSPNSTQAHHKQQRRGRQGLCCYVFCCHGKQSTCQMHLHMFCKHVNAYDDVDSVTNTRVSAQQHQCVCVCVVHISLRTCFTVPRRKGTSSGTSPFLCTHVDACSNLHRGTNTNVLAQHIQRGPRTDNIAQHSAVHDGIIDVVPAAFWLPVHPIGQAHL